MKQTLMILMSLFIVGGYAISQTTVPLWKTLPDVPQMSQAAESGLAAVDDIKMYYAIFNKEGKEPVILLHGGFGSSDDWGFEVPLLSKTHKVIIVDSRGRGRSTISDQPLSYNLMSSDVLKLMDYLKIKKASIVGWSDGGIIGLIMAIQYPEHVNKLFTFGANYNLSPTPDSFFVLRKALGQLYSTEPNLKPGDIRTIKAPTVIACGQYEQF